MRNLKLFGLLMLGLMVAFSSCKKDDDDDGTPVEITNIEISDDNKTLTVTFNQAVYKNADQTGNLDAESFAITFIAANPVNAQYSASHTAGSTTATINIVYQNRPDGDETLELKALAGKVFGATGNSVSADIVTTVDVKEIGIIGYWSAYDIGGLLAGLGFDDSLYAKFNLDQSYRVTAYAGGAPVILEGSYTMEKSEFDDIWNISLDQSTPSVLTSQGIFKVFPAAQDSMWYEVAQIDPVIPGVTPPTAEAGFGSTSGGVLGTTNVQKYFWIGE
jgi:hypothetical protein